jgi:hypothetical protein
MRNLFNKFNAWMDTETPPILIVILAMVAVILAVMGVI